MRMMNRSRLTLTPRVDKHGAVVKRWVKDGDEGSGKSSPAIPAPASVMGPPSVDERKRLTGEVLKVDPKTKFVISEAFDKLSDETARALADLVKNEGLEGWRTVSALFFTPMSIHPDETRERSKSFIQLVAQNADLHRMYYQNAIARYKDSTASDRWEKSLEAISVMGYGTTRFMDELQDIPDGFDPSDYRDEFRAACLAEMLSTYIVRLTPDGGLDAADTAEEHRQVIEEIAPHMDLLIRNFECAKSVKEALLYTARVLPKASVLAEACRLHEELDFDTYSITKAVKERGLDGLSYLAGARDSGVEPSLLEGLL